MKMSIVKSKFLIIFAFFARAVPVMAATTLTATSSLLINNPESCPEKNNHDRGENHKQPAAVAQRTFQIILGAVIGGIVLVWRLVVAVWSVPLTVYRRIVGYAWLCRFG